MNNKTLNIARAYLSLPKATRAAYRKARKAFFNGKEFQNALTMAGNEVRLQMHASSCVQAYISKRAKVDGKIGNHKLVCENSNSN